MLALTFDPTEQRRRRRRNRITQADIAKRLGISDGALSQYENGKTPLPFELTGEDYELAMAQALIDRANGGQPQ